MFKEFEDHSRVWIYQANRELQDSEIVEIESLAKSFLSDWNAHGKSLVADFQIHHKVFLILVVDELQAQATGCSIDKSVAFFRSIDEKYQLDLFNRFNFAYKEDSSVKVGNLQKNTSMLSEETEVFNNLVDKVSDLRESWSVKVADSWHKQFI